MLHFSRPLCVALTVLACTGEVGTGSDPRSPGPGGMFPGGGGRAGVGGTGGPASTGGTGGPAGTGGIGVATTVAIASGLRRMTVWEYGNTVRDLVGEPPGAHATVLPTDDV